MSVQSIIVYQHNDHDVDVTSPPVPNIFTTWSKYILYHSMQYMSVCNTCCNETCRAGVCVALQWQTNRVRKECCNEGMQVEGSCCNSRQIRRTDGCKIQVGAISVAMKCAEQTGCNKKPVTQLHCNGTQEITRSLLSTQFCTKSIASRCGCAGGWVVLRCCNSRRRQDVARVDGLCCNGGWEQAGTDAIVHCNIYQ